MISSPLATSSRTIPVGSSVMLIKYDLITPFCSSSGGGIQVKRILLELTATASNDCGDPVGTAFNEGKESKYTQNCYNVHNILPSSSVVIVNSAPYGPVPIVSAATANV